MIAFKVKFLKILIFNEIVFKDIKNNIRGGLGFIFIVFFRNVVENIC